MALIAWHGWQLQVPEQWNPVKLEGDYRRGYALLADMERPRLGIRWQKPRARRFDPRDFVRRVMLDEVGKLATDEARPHRMSGEQSGQWDSPLLYLEPDPPGRDVFVAVSKVSQRAVEIVYHAQRRERLLADGVLPKLLDQPADQPMAWSVFELSCVCPPGLELQTKRLNPGDLSLSFADRRRLLTVRQVAVAELALKRMPLEKWLAQQNKLAGKHYRADGRPGLLEFETDRGTLTGLTGPAVRRRRFFWMRWLPTPLPTWALHDQRRDRLVLLQATDEALLRQVAPTVGFAAGVE